MLLREVDVIKTLLIKILLLIFLKKFRFKVILDEKEPTKYLLDYWRSI